MRPFLLVFLIYSLIFLHKNFQPYFHDFQLNKLENIT